ncbi:Ig-like domain-containing protein [Mucilaginibacter sabulilitoris]|uniref:Ig-like domain-containing protein n=1 Tax=Mucilaginibacter sabulilitoris TaxID=1173583 RepID=A0ABZ0TL36_9SPHI|nr:Ig-like domain-containing protein [Mucilaginibacter sabulilitoris]WPU92434.1 Ig-like domain-containing protein [Mucilaginibacter sabulilitoris]
MAYPQLDTCDHVSTLPCSAVKVNLPYNLSFNSAVSNTIADKNGLGTGFTTINNYSGVRLAADGLPSNTQVPGYEPSKIALAAGRLQLVSNKGIDFLTANNQLNVLGVKIAAIKKLQLDVKVINPYNGTQSQQAGLWYGLNDRTYVKLNINGNKVELRKELNDVSSNATGNANPDQRITAAISGLNTKTVTLRLVIDSAARTAEGFYSTDGVNFISAGAAYTSRTVNITGMGLIDSTAYAGIYASYRNGTAPITYNFDDLAITNLEPATVKVLSFAPATLNFTLIKGGNVIPQLVCIQSTQGHPTYTLTKTNADWLNLPQNPTDTIVFNSAAIDSTTNAGTYQAIVTAAAPGYQPATLLVNLNVINAVQQQTMKINFQDPQTVPPLGYIRDYGQPYGLRTGLYQGSGFEFGWRKRTDGSLLNLTPNTRNRNLPEDILLATLIHMQANTISTVGGTFNGVKIEGYWEAKVPNGTYDVTVSVGDGTVNASPEKHSINIEGVNAINLFIPSGKQGTIGRFKSATTRVTVADEYLTINADGGINTKLNFANIVPVSLNPYLYWATTNQNLLIKKGSPVTNSVSVSLGSSNNLATAYNVAVTYASGATGWISLNPAQTGVQPNVAFNYTAAKNLPVGIYKATVKATSGQFTSAVLPVQISVVDSLRPYVVSSTPANGAINIPVSTVSIAANNLRVPVVAGFQGGVDNSTITNASVKLYKQVDTSLTLVPGVVQGTGGGDAISFSPSSSLLPNTIYKFVITSDVKSYAGAAFAPYEATFTTEAAKIDSSTLLNAQFTKIAVPGTQNKKYSSVKIGPDDKFYALRLDGAIERYIINHADGSLTLDKTIRTLINKYGNRSAIGLAFDPRSTATNVIVWVSHSSAGLTTAPAFDGNISRLSGDSLQNEQLMVTKLPRSTRDHMVNGLSFGPDNALYICQGSNSSAGSFDNDWQRAESLLSGTVLRLDTTKLNAFVLPLNVQTTSTQSVINSAPAVAATMSDGTYNPYGSNSPLTIYASGVRNAYDLVWHTNGQLYLPTNGSGGGGNSPASVAGTRRPDGSLYNGPVIPATTGVQVQNDWLFRVNPDKPVGYYGHPNPLRGEYVINRGFADNPLYSPAIVADIRYRPAYNFGLNNSPDGALEYKSNTFNGVLKGKLLVCRFSGGGDIIVMQPGSLVKDNSVGSDDRIYDIVKVTTGSGNSGLVGMSGFANPLDITEDVVNGNLYVIEYNWNDNPNLISQITLLKVTGSSPPPAMLSLTAVPQTAANEYQDKEYEVTLSNRGDRTVKVKDISIYGTDASKVKIANIPLPNKKAPLILKKNSSLTFKVYLRSPLKDALNAKLKVTSIEDTIKVVDVSGAQIIDSVKKNGGEKEATKDLKGDERVLQAYPNPNGGGPLYVKLRNFKVNEVVTISLYSMDGKKLKTIKITTNAQGQADTHFEIKPDRNKYYIIRAVYSSGFKYAKILINSP